MIRFSAFLVLVAVGLLVAGVVTSKLLLAYLAIGVSGVALLALGVGTAIKWRELFGKPKTAEPQAAEARSAEPQTAEPELGQPDPVAVHAPLAYSQPQASPRPAAVPAGAGQPATAQAGPSLADSLPSDAMAGGAAATAWGSGRSSAGLPDARPAAPVTRNAAVEQAEEGQQPAKDQPSAGSRQPAKDRKAPGDHKAPQDPKASKDQYVKEHEQPAGHEHDEEPVAPADGQAGSAPAKPEQDSATPRADKPAPVGADLQREVTVVPGVPRYHHARCMLIRFMGNDDLNKMTLAAARKAGCTPCRACLPDQPEKNSE